MEHSSHLNEHFYGPKLLKLVFQSHSESLNCSFLLLPQKCSPKVVHLWNFLQPKSYLHTPLSPLLKNGPPALTRGENVSKIIIMQISSFSVRESFSCELRSSPKIPLLARQPERALKSLALVVGRAPAHTLGCALASLPHCYHQFI
jgi:hypothetical protein